MNCVFPFSRFLRCTAAALRLPAHVPTDFFHQHRSFCMTTFNTSLQSRKQRGQGMTEYIIIVALIGVAAIAV